MSTTVQNEGLKLARLFMVLSSLSPIFLLWAVRGVRNVPDKWLWIVCSAFIAVPNFMLWLRMKMAATRNDAKTLTVGKAEDHREHLLVYLFAMLIPLYDANIGSARDTIATALAFAFVVFLFWHLNLHYMNLVFAICGYRVFTVHPQGCEVAIAGQHPFVLLTRRSQIQEGQQIRAYRISNTVFFEPKGGL